MRYHVLAVDYDGTIAHDGIVDRQTIEALSRLKASGRRLVLVTGRRLEPLLEIFPELNLFDRVVAENGALIYSPKEKRERLIASPPNPQFVTRLQELGVSPIEYGRVIVAMWRPHEHAVLEAISESNLELQIVFNKDAVMVLPSGINKSVGLQAALSDMGYSRLNVVAVGDAENDLTMLETSGASGAVSNALDSVKATADVVLTQARGAGVCELIDKILESDLIDLPVRSTHKLSLGEYSADKTLELPLLGESLLITGGPGGGKSKLAIAFVEQLAPRGAQACIIDPEGDYQGVEASVVLGTADRAPEIEEVVRALENPADHCIVSLFAVEKKDRPDYFNRLYMGLAELRSRTGHPHWIIVDEAHYAVPRERTSLPNLLKTELEGLMFVTAYADRLAPEVLNSVHWIICVSDDPRESISVSREIIGEGAIIPEPPQEKEKRALVWKNGSREPVWFLPASTDAENFRHQHSYLEGELEAGQRFVFRGPDSKLNLQAQNINIFMQLLEGIDDETYLFHLQRHDYSRWFDEVIHDDEIAQRLNEIEQTESATGESRTKLIDIIRERFAEKF
jgi:hydroxymethylpyrimidine pyrophosphatase-like HAD family hydrolase